MLNDNRLTSSLAFAALFFGTGAAAGQDFPDEPPKPSAKKSSMPLDAGVPSRLPDSPPPAKRSSTPPSASKGDSPDGSPEAILKFMESSLQVDADDSKPAEVRSAFRVAFHSILSAADNVLNHPNATENQRNDAYQYQASVLYQGARKGEIGYSDRLERLADALHRSQPRTDVANLANFLSVKARHEDDDGLQPDALPAVKEYLKRYPREEAAIELIVDLANSAEIAGRNDVAKEAFQIVQQSFKRHVVAAKIPSMFRRLDLVGKKMSLEVSLMDGKRFTFDDPRKKVVVVSYWATWCQPCLAEQEILKDLYGRFKSEGVEILGVPLDDKETTVHQFLAKNKVQWPQAVIPFDSADHGLNHPLAKQFGLLQVPTTFLVVDGKVVATQIRGPSLKRKVEDLMAKSGATRMTDRIDPPSIK